MLRFLSKLFRAAKSAKNEHCGGFDPMKYVFPESMIAEANANPNGWVYMIDGVTDPKGAVPPERIFGCFKVDSKGRLTREFQANPNYRKLG